MSKYVWQHDLKGESDRLRLMSKLLDPSSAFHLLRMGTTAGWDCLEIGAGNGSLSQWLRSASDPRARGSRNGGSTASGKLRTSCKAKAVSRKKHSTSFLHSIAMRPIGRQILHLRQQPYSAQSTIRRLKERRCKDFRIRNRGREIYACVASTG